MAQRGVEPVARHHHQYRHVALKQIIAHEQANLLTFLEFDQPEDRIADVLGRRRKQLVLGEAVEDLDDFLVRVRPFDEIFGLDDLLQLAAQHRDVAGLKHVRLRSHEADQTRFTGDPAVGGDVAHPDVVHLGASMHPRPSVGLRDDDQRAFFVARPQGGCQRLHGCGFREPRLLFVGEYPEAGSRLDPDHWCALLFQYLVLAVAEKDVVVVEDPLEKRDRLVDLLLGIPRRTLAGDLEHPVDRTLHPLEVADCIAHVLEHGQKLGLDQPRFVGAEGPLEFVMLNRLSSHRSSRRQYVVEAAVGRPRDADHRVEHPL